MSYGVLTFGKIAITERYTVKEQSGDGRGLSIDGQDSSPPLTPAQLMQRHTNIVASAHRIVSVTFENKPEFNGFYYVDTAEAELTNWNSDVVRCDWSLSLSRLGTESEVEFESVLNGSGRTNPHGVTGVRTHAAPIGSYAYMATGAEPGVVSRTTADGAINFYTGVSENARWAVAPANFTDGAVYLTNSLGALQGTQHDLDPADFVVSNGLVRVSDNAGALVVDAWDGAWVSKEWNVTVSGTNQTWDAATVLRNDEEEVVLRLTSSQTVGRLTLDLRVRRGQRFVTGFLQRHAAATLSVLRATAEAGTAGTGFVTATADDADGNTYIAGSSAGVTLNTTTGGVTLAATTTLPFFLGSVIGGSTATYPENGTGLMEQYIGLPAVTTRALKR